MVSMKPTMASSADSSTDGHAIEMVLRSRVRSSGSAPSGVSPFRTARALNSFITGFSFIFHPPKVD